MARLTGAHDVLPLLAAEFKTATDVDMCILAAFDCLAFTLRNGLEDPATYLAGWIEQERRLADDEENGPDQR